MPNVPTIAEQGFPGFEVAAWWGVLAPAHTPKPILDRMQAELVKVLGQAAVRDKLTQQGMEIVAGGPEVLSKFVAGEMERWGRVVKDNGIKAGE